VYITKEEQLAHMNATAVVYNALRRQVHP